MMCSQYSFRRAGTKSFGADTIQGLVIEESLSIKKKEEILLKPKLIIAS